MKPVEVLQPSQTVCRTCERRSFVDIAVQKGNSATRPPKGGILIFWRRDTAFFEPLAVPIRRESTSVRADRETRAMAEATPLYDTYMRAPLRFERGEGVWLIAENGERYLDFGAGVAVSSLGHGHPHLVDALKAQADKVWHLSNLYEVPGQETLGQRLTEATFADKVFFTNSGAEALECAIKTARRYQFVKGHPERFHIITFEGAFHGRTLATIAAGGQAKYLEGFGPKAPGFDQIPFGDHEALKNAIGPETAGILI